MVQCTHPVTEQSQPTGGLETDKGGGTGKRRSRDESLDQNWNGVVCLPEGDPASIHSGLGEGRNGSDLVGAGGPKELPVGSHACSDPACGFMGQ